MSILDSSIAPYLILLTVVAVLGGFFRKILIHLAALVVAEVILLALFPILLVRFIDIIQWARHLLVK